MEMKIIALATALVEAGIRHGLNCFPNHIKINISESGILAGLPKPRPVLI